MPAPTALAIPRLHPYVGRDVRWLLEQRMRTHRDRPYIIWDPFEGTGCELTYSEFGAAVARVAGGFVEHGIKAGDFVLIHLGNCPEFLIAWHACARVGAVAVTTNTRSSRDELAYYAANCAAVAAITQPSFVDTVAACLPDARWIAATATDLGASPASFSAGGVLPFDRLMGDPDRVPLRRYNPLAYNSVQYHVGHDGTAERRRLDACECPVGRADDGVASAIDRPRQGARVFSALPHELAHVRFAWQPMGRRFNRGPAPVIGQPLLGTGDPPPLHLDVHVAVRPPNARRASGPGAAFLSLLGMGTADPPLARTRFNVQGLGWFGMTETVTFPLIGGLDFPGHPLGMGRPAAGYDVAVV